MTVPKHVLWFEVLLYLSLILDALTAAFQDRTPDAETTETMIVIANAIGVVLLVLFAFLVGLAARRRKNWPRWVLTASLVFSAISLAQIIYDSGAVQAESGIQIVSCFLTAVGLYFSFTGDARGWFNA